MKMGNLRTKMIMSTPTIPVEKKHKNSGTIDLSFTRSRSELFYLRAPQ